MMKVKKYVRKGCEAYVVYATNDVKIEKKGVNNVYQLSKSILMCFQKTCQECENSKSLCAYSKNIYHL